MNIRKLKSNYKRNRLIHKFLFSIKNHNKEKNAFLQTLTSLSIYTAWYFLSAIAIYIGYIPIGLTQITYLAVIIVIATFHLGFIGNITTGLAFGFSSWIAAFIYGIPKYQFFDIAVLPRLETALITLLFFYIFNAFKKPKLWKFIILAFLVTVLNQYLVLFSQYIHEFIAIKAGYDSDILVKSGVLPIKIWIITHPINLTFEPILNILIIIFMFPLVLNIKHRYVDNKKIHY